MKASVLSFPMPGYDNPRYIIVRQICKMSMRFLLPLAQTFNLEGWSMSKRDSILSLGRKMPKPEWPFRTRFAGLVWRVEMRWDHSLLFGLYFTFPEAFTSLNLEVMLRIFSPLGYKQRLCVLQLQWTGCWPGPCNGRISSFEPLTVLLNYRFLLDLSVFSPCHLLCQQCQIKSLLAHVSLSLLYGGNRARDG